MNQPDIDRHWMCRAIEQAELGIGLTSPNPPVGAVIVNGDQLIGEGSHMGAGLPHAERSAIEDAKSRNNAHLLEGSTLYVTLEPCSTHGKTPPCTDAIIEHKIKRVVFGSQDQNPQNAKKALTLLWDNGIQVECGIMQMECDKLIRPFCMAHTSSRPWIIAKTAMTLDGRITRMPGSPRWLTGEDSRGYVHSLRAVSDAVLIGGETLRRDDPALTIRTPLRPVSASKKQPWRIVLTRDKSSLPPHSQVFTDSWHERTLVIEQVEDYHQLLKKMVHDYGVHTLMLECGGRLLRKFLELELVDEWVGFYAPMITGGGDYGVAGDDFLPLEAHLKHIEYIQLGDDLCIRGQVSY